MKPPVVIPYTYLYGNRLSLTEYYRQKDIRTETCPRCGQEWPRWQFRSRQGIWVCGTCAWKQDSQRWRDHLARLS